MTSSDPIPQPPGRWPADEHGIFHALFAAYPDALIVTDAAGRIVLANQTSLNLLGYERAALIGANVDILVPDLARERHASHRKAYADNPRPRAMGTDAELVARRRDGTEVMVEIALSPLRDRGSTYVVAAIRSIAEFPRVKLALRRARYSEHLARLGRIAADARDPMTLLEHVPVIATEALEAESSRVLLLEPDGRRFRVAAGVGLVPAEPIGETIAVSGDTVADLVITTGRSLRLPDLRRETRPVVPPEYIEAGFASGLFVPLVDRGRTIGTLSVMSSVPDRFKDHDLQFVEALSSTLATALQRAETEEALSHAQRLETVGQLTGGIAHDFNNLLTIIHGNLQVIEELPGVGDDPYGRELVASALRAAKRGAELTSKLLTFSRRQVLRPSRIEIEPMLRSLAEMLQRTVDQRIRIEVDIAEPGLAVDVDAGQLESALLNIAINARDAMPRGGRLRFYAFASDVLPPNVRREPERLATPPGSYVGIAVSDDGEGMSDEVRERAFEPFFTTKPLSRGTGLGLSTVYGFVTQSNGAVSIESRAGAGSTLTLYLPRQVDRGPASPRVARRAGRAVPGGLRVLVVEDDPGVRQVALRFLASMDARVTAVANGEEARQALDRQAPFDLMLTDVALGAGIRGTELAAEAGRRYPGLAILLMSGFASDRLDRDGRDLRRYEMLPKPFDRAALSKAIQRALQRSRPVGRSTTSR
jgi:PAS domain S-box-containing protein